MGIIEVTHDDIKRLDQFQLTRLLSKLLDLEAQAHGISRSAIGVSPEINVPDGGEDGRIKWENGPESTEWLPKRFTVFQCKARKMDPGDCAKEIVLSDGSSLKPAVQKALDSGGAYIVFCREPYNEKEREDRISRIRQTLEELGRADAETAGIDFYDAEKIKSWTNCHFSAAVFVWEQVGRHLPQGIQTWGSLNEYRENRRDYVANPILQECLQNIREHIAQPQSVLRIVGLPGLGKTRLVFEAFRPPADASDTDQKAFSDRMLYCDAAIHQDHLIDFVQHMHRQRLEPVLVVDNCPLELHNGLAREVTRTDGRLSLLTVSPDVDDYNKGEPVVVLRPDMLHDVVGLMLQAAYPQLHKIDTDPIARLAEGHPKMAVLFAEARLRGDEHIGQLTDKQLLERLVWARGERDDKVWSVVRACALFEYFGFSGRVKDQWKFVANSICSISENDFHEVCKRLQERGILQRRGDYLRVVPKPLALALAADWWRTVPPENVFQVLDGAVSKGLDQPFFGRMRELDFVQEVQDVVETLCASDRPFSQPDTLNSERGSWLFLSIVEVNPKAAVSALERVFGLSSQQELLEVKAGRRNLVWALERLCWWPEMFPTAARLLLAFAAAENESWGNNATNQFLQLFHVCLPGTRASLRERLPIIRDALAFDSHEKRELGVKALGSALQTHHFSRQGGVETQGSRAPQNDYYPQPDEMFAYWDECIEMLTDIACSGSEFSGLAVEKIASNISGLISQGRLDKLEIAIRRITEVRGPHWPEALQGIKHALQYEGPRMPEEARSRVERWVDLLTPTDLPTRLRLTVSNPVHETTKNGEGHFVDLAAERAKALAEELSRTSQDWYEHLPLLFDGHQYYGHVFGRRLGELTENPRTFIERALDCLVRIPAERANASVLLGFLATLPDRDLVASTLDRIVSDDRLIHFAVDATAWMRPQDKDLDRLLKAVETGRVPLLSLRTLEIGGVLDHLPPDSLKFLCNRLTAAGADGAVRALGILFTYCDQSKERWSAKDTFREILMTSGLLAKTEGIQALSGYNWQEAAAKLLNADPGDKELAMHICREIVSSCTDPEFGMRSDHDVRPIVRILLRTYGDLSWPLFGDALLTDDWRVYHSLKHFLEEGHDPERDPAPLLEVPNDILFIWCRANGSKAAAAIAEIVPLYVEKSGGVAWSDVARGIIDDFGYSDEVLDALSSNLFSFSATGSIVPYYQLRLSLLNDLKNLSNAKVRAWATKRIEALEEGIKRESGRDEERDLGIF